MLLDNLVGILDLHNMMYKPAVICTSLLKARAMNKSIVLVDEGTRVRANETVQKSDDLVSANGVSPEAEFNPHLAHADEPLLCSHASSQSSQSSGSFHSRLVVFFQAQFAWVLCQPSHLVNNGVHLDGRT